MIKILAILYIVALIFFGWGYAMVRYQAFPWQYFYPLEQNVIAFVQGDPDEKTDLVEKIKNDIDARPSRQLHDYVKNPDRNYQRVSIPNLRSRRLDPLVYSTEQKLPGFRFFFGTMDFNEYLHGAVLFDQNDQLVHTWVLDQEKLLKRLEQDNKVNNKNIKIKPASRRLPHGVDVFPDGSLILAEGAQGNGLQKLDFCGNFDWSRPGNYHHTVSYQSSSDTLWTFGPKDMEEIDRETGKLLRTISFVDMHRANPDLAIFTPRRDHSRGRWLQDPVHKNDIEPLPEELASAYPMFEAGDLLISHRSTNLIFVMDPKTLKIKWWRSGQWRRQHDPDWHPSGTISIYDNNMRDLATEQIQILDSEVPRYSQFWRIDPASYVAEKIYSGERDNFYSGARGDHQVLPNGNILFTSPYQGRILEVTPDGETAYEFVNQYDEKQSLTVTDVKWLPLDYFNFDISENNQCD